MIKIAVLISGTGTNLRAIINACERGEINGRVVMVGSDNPEAKGFKFAKEANIPTFTLDYKAPAKLCKGDLDKVSVQIKIPDDFNLKDILCKEHILQSCELMEKKIRFFYSRAIVEADLISKLKPEKINLLALAGFMRVLTPYAIDRINTDGAYRIMNIHPALLPAFPGTDGYGDMFNYGCKVGGCTVHFVDYGEDTGPIIGQSAYPIDPNDTVETIKEKGLKLEWELYPQCIRLFAEGRLRVIENETGRRIVKILPEK